MFKKKNHKCFKKLNDVTPPFMKCGLGACPAIFKSERSFFLIGRKVDKSEVGHDIFERVGNDEVLIEIPETLLANVVLKTRASG